MTSEEVGTTRTGNFWLELSQLLHNTAILDSPRPHSSHKTTVQRAEAGDLCALGPAGPRSLNSPPAHARLVSLCPALSPPLDRPCCSAWALQ